MMTTFIFFVNYPFNMFYYKPDSKKVGTLQIVNKKGMQ